MSTNDNPSLFLVGDVDFTVGRPSGCDNLTSLYGLDSLAASVARFDPATGVKRKLRKSYKNEISDLPGKHTIPGPNETAENWSLVNIARQPPRFDPSKPPPELKKINEKALENGLAFDRSPLNGIPDFNVALLATDFTKPGGASPDDAEVHSDKQTKKRFGVGVPFSKKPVHANSAGSMTAESSNDESLLTKRAKKKRPKDLSSMTAKRQKV